MSNKELRLHCFKMSLGIIEYDERMQDAISQLPILEFLKMENYKKVAQEMPYELKVVLLSAMETALDIATKNDEIDEPKLQQYFMKFAVTEIQGSTSGIRPLQLMKSISKN